MGYLYADRLSEAIDEIKMRAHRATEDGASQSVGSSGASNCLVLVAPDADAICSSIIIERVLTGEKVLHDVMPVAGYLEVVAKCQGFGESLRSIILVNCGASTDLKGLLWPEFPDDPEAAEVYWSLHKDCHVYVLDSHRPFNHRNVRNEDNVTVLDWRELPEGGDLVPRMGDSDFEDSDSEEDDDDEGSEAEEDNGADDDDDGENDSNAGGEDDPTKKKRRRLRKAGGGGSDSEDGLGSQSSSDSSGTDDSDSDGGAARGKGRRGGGVGDGSPRAKQRRLDETMREQRRMRARRHKEYYNGQFYGVPSSLIAYEVAKQMDYGRNDLLWLAIVGVTEYFLEDRISMERYTDYYRALSEFVHALNDSEDGDGGSAGTTNGDGTLERSGQFGRISHSEEPRFVAYRHWSLDSAMFYSDYVATRLRDSDADDSFESLRAQLDKLQALCGVPAKLFRQDYKYMPRPDSDRFFDRLRRIIAGESSDSGVSATLELGSDLMFPSFVRQRDMERPVCAGDVVYAMHGLLIGGAAAAATAAREQALAGLMSEAGRLGSASSSSSSSSSGNGGDGTQGTDASSSSELHEPSVITTLAGREWSAGWINAKDCLRRPELFFRGLASYMALRQAVHRLGGPFASRRRSGLILDGEIIRMIEFAPDGPMTEGDRRLFAQPLALSSLAAHIIKLNRDSNARWRKRSTGKVDPRPLVIVIVHPRAGAGGTSLASLQGFPVKEADHVEAVTWFQDAFRDAARLAGVRAFMDGFDASTMLITDDSRAKVLAEIDRKLQQG